MRAGSPSLPPKIKAPAPPSLTAFAVIALGAAVLGAGAVVFFFNPGTHGFYPACLFHELTGLNCPGCGGTRSLYALLHGNVALALKDNALFVVLLAAAVGRGVWFAAKKFRRQTGRKFFAGEIFFVGVARRRRDFHGVAESAGVRLSFAVAQSARTFFAFAGAPGGVQFQHESDTSIDNDDV